MGVQGRASERIETRGVVAPGRRSRWEWTRWTRWPFTPAVMAVATIAVTVDAVTAWAGVSLGSLGRVPVSPALPLGLLLACMIGLNRLGFDRTNRRAWREFLVVVGGVLAYAVVSYALEIGGWPEALGLVLAALGEELIYRLAIIIVVGALIARLLGRDWRNASEWGLAPGLAALLIGSLVFSALPGHIAQMSDALHALPFASLGLVLGYAVLRTGALIPAAIVHALLNLVTLAVLAGDMSVAVRNAISTVALLALVSGTVVAGLRLGVLRRTPVEVDLTVPTSATPTVGAEPIA
ncbi:MAG: CPBP family intramembrane glutamic endopeptidase [Acidimicrobiia bacterium]